jgi:hypothetical protein
VKANMRIGRVRDWQWTRRILFIDVDPGCPVYSKRHMSVLLARAGYKLVDRVVVRSKSKKGRHVAVLLDRQTSCNMETVALQAALGSDRYREVCNVGRVRTIATYRPALAKFWQDRWNVLYDPNFSGKRNAKRRVASLASLL